MCPHQMSRSEGTAETELPSQHAGRDDPCQLSSVVARMGGVCASHAEEVEAGALGFEDGAAAYGADFDGGHGYGDL